MAWVKQMLDAGQSPNMIGEIPSYYNMLRWGNDVDHNLGLPEMWEANIKENLVFFDSIPERLVLIEDLSFLEGKAVIVVGASPILKKTWHHLKDIDREHFVIAASNSSAMFLCENGIIPDYIFLIDGQQFDWVLDIKDPHPVLVCSPFAVPKVIKAWKNKYVVLPFHLKNEWQAKEIERRFGKLIGQAGNSFNCAVAFFVQCTAAKIFLFVGNELSFVNNYYVDSKSRNDQSMYFFATDVNGKKVKTLIPLFHYKIWLENLMAELSTAGYFFYNCSEGILGVDMNDNLMPCVTAKPLDEAIKQTLEAFDFEGKEEMVKSKQLYDLLFATGRYWPQNGAHNWLSVHEKIVAGEFERFKSGLDVGCGHGFSVYEMSKHGYNVLGADIADNSKSWKELGISDKCFIAPAHKMPFGDDTFDFVVCSDVMEHIPEKYIEQSLKEIYRVGNGKFWFVIANGEDTPSKGLPPVHLVLGDLNFWLGKILSIGFDVVYADENKHHCSIVAEKSTKCL